jgi:hypothetical protein
MFTQKIYALWLEEILFKALLEETSVTLPQSLRTWLQEAPSPQTLKALPQLNRPADFLSAVSSRRGAFQRRLFYFVRISFPCRVMRR